MYKYLPALLTALIALSGCSESADTSAQQTPVVDNADEATQPHKISQDNPFSTQVNALNTARAVSSAAQQSIDSNQQQLQDSQP